jgi:hypothetical protein
MNKNRKYHRGDSSVVLIHLILLCIAHLFFSSICLAQGDIWTTRAPIPSERLWFSCEVVDGKIYAIGGATVSGAPTLAMVEAYDPVTDTWDTAKTDMPTARCLIASAAVDGKIYIVGGDRTFQMHTTNGVRTLEVYDTAKDTWDTTKTDMPTARSSASACAVNGFIYVIGGVRPGGAVTRVVEAYDPVTDTWTTKAPMPTARWALSTVVVEGKIYAMGSGQGARTVEAYDPAIDTWITKASMPVGQGYFGTGVIDGIIYTVGGSPGEGSNHSRVFAYDPSADEWSEQTAMPAARSMLGAGVINGKIYAIGGNPGWPPSPITTNTEYDPHLDLSGLIEKVNVNRGFVKPGIDSVMISTKMKDPAGITLMAELVTTDQTTLDSLQLFDDGNHHDGNAGDSLYANIWAVTSAEEQTYDVDLRVTRVDTDTVIHRMNQLAAFTTIGPVVFDSFSYRGSDTEPNPGDNIRIYVTLKNNGKTAAATDIEAQLVSMDTSWVRVQATTQTYPDIPPGETGRNFISSRLDILDAYPGNTPIPMEIQISSQGTVFWSDSFSITADLTDVQSMVKSGPSRFALSDNYPNPFNPETTIEYAVKEPCEVRLIVTNLLCQTVKELIHSYHQPGEYTVHVNMDENSSGLYFYQISMGNFQAVKKMVKIE